MSLVIPIMEYEQQLCITLNINKWKSTSVGSKNHYRRLKTIFCLPNFKFIKSRQKAKPTQLICFNKDDKGLVSGTDFRRMPHDSMSKRNNYYREARNLPFNKCHGKAHLKKYKTITKIVIAHVFDKHKINKYYAIYHLRKGKKSIF